MAAMLAMPLVILLIVVAVLERLWWWARGVKRSGRSASAAGLEELAATFQGSKRVELEQRQVESMLRDDETDGAPPADRIDLDGGVAFIARPGKR